MHPNPTPFAMNCQLNIRPYGQASQDNHQFNKAQLESSCVILFQAIQSTTLSVNRFGTFWHCHFTIYGPTYGYVPIT